MKKSHILITGAKGEIGTELIKSISKNSSCNILTLDLHELDSDISAITKEKVVSITPISIDATARVSLLDFEKKMRTLD